MAKLEFNDLEFSDDKESVKVIFLKYFYFNIEKSELLKIGGFKFDTHSIEFDASDKRSSKFYELIDRGISELKSIVTGKKTIFVHKGAGIPLIGNNSFGIVDRGSSLIEIKPVCGCNLSCIYCSVDEDKRSVDFIVDKDYLIDELKKVVTVKKHDVEIHIGCNGEPLLYSNLILLITEIKTIPNVKRISMDTNGTLLTEKIIDELIDAGLTRFNLSLNSLDSDLAKKIAGGGFSVNHAKKIAKYIKNKRVDLTLAPVWMQGVNDNDIEEIIKLGKEINAELGIQNYLYYQFGKNPVKEIEMETFYEKLKALEEKYGIKLILKASDFHIKNDESYPKIFEKGDIVDAVLVCQGRLSNEKIAVAKDRTISVYDCDKKIGQKVRLKINRSKHNIYSAVCV